MLQRRMFWKLRIVPNDGEEIARRTGDDGEGPAAAQVVETGYVVAVLVSEQNVFRDEMVLRCIRVD